MITHSFYERDNRVKRYAEALVQRGESVEVISLRRSPDVPYEDVINGVNVHRVQDRFGKKERSMASFLFPLLRFLLVSSRRLNKLHKQKPFDLVHVHNFPDFMVFGAWYVRLAGAKVV